MNIVAFTAPGRFPTVIHDPGGWWSVLAGAEGFRVTRVSSNYRWWRVLCSPMVADIFGRTTVRRFIRKFQRNALRRSAIAAGHSLDKLSDPATYESPSSYLEAITPIANHLEELNRVQDELQFNFETGVSVARLNYDDSRALVDYGRRKTLLSELIATSLTEFPQDVDLLVVNVTYPEDLLCAMIAVQHLRLQRPTMHACLADHGYENFSLTPHLAKLRTAGTLDTVFDTIIESKDERDTVLPALAQALAHGKIPRGFLRFHHVSEFQQWVGNSNMYVAPLPVPTFAKEPLFWTRFSPRRCYWDRCTFCVQNLKFEQPTRPSLNEVSAVLDRLEVLVAAGYGTVILSDEALSPAILDNFSRGIIERGLKLRWSCRCKLELAFTSELFQRMHEAGCCQALFGLESISPRMLRRMDKYAEGLDATAIDNIFRALDRAGIGLHVNLIGGFPGDTPEEVTASVEFVIRSLATLSNATVLLNRFALFHGSPVMNNPATFGIEPVHVDGDMPWGYPFEYAPGFKVNGLAVERLLPELKQQLMTGLGWDRFGAPAKTQAAINLYSLSGHRFSSVFQARSQDQSATFLLSSVPKETVCPTPRSF